MRLCSIQQWCLLISGDDRMNLHLKKITHSVPARGALASAVMRVAAALAVAFSLVACASAGPSNCDPSYECAFEYTTPDGSKSYKFDFSSLCGTMDYTFTDRAQHTYYAHICGRTNHYCLPGEWALFLVALQRCAVAP